MILAVVGRGIFDFSPDGILCDRRKQIFCESMIKSKSRIPALQSRFIFNNRALTA
jgi:hypothetical protein